MEADERQEKSAQESEKIDVEDVQHEQKEEEQRRRKERLEEEEEKKRKEKLEESQRERKGKMEEAQTERQRLAEDVRLDWLDRRPAVEAMASTESTEDLRWKERRRKRSEDSEFHLLVTCDDNQDSQDPLERSDKTPAELRDAVKNGNYMAVKRSKEDYNLDQQATLIHRRSPAVSISKQQLSALTRRLVDLEAKVGLLEARLNERSHPPTADKSTATDSPVDVLPTPVEPRTECQQATHIHPSGHGEFSLTNGHLDIDSFGFPSAVSTPCIDRTRPADITEDSAYLNHQLSKLDYNYSPVQESASTMSSTSQECPSAMSSFCLRLPETPIKASNFQLHNSVRRSLMGVILQDVTLNHVSVEVEKQLYVDAAGSDGTPRADRFAAGLFKRLIPLTVYHDWVGSVNYDGSKGKNALPLNVRQAISDAVARKFHPSLCDWKLVRDRINELLRKKRLSFPLF